MITSQTLEEVSKEKQLYLAQKFFARTNNFQNFNEITEDKINQLTEDAEDFLRNTEQLSKKNRFLLSIIALKEKELSYDEQVLWLILVNDKALMALRIFKEESDLKNVQKKCLSTIGFYQKGFIEFEKIYHQNILKSMPLPSYQKNILPNKAQTNEEDNTKKELLQRKKYIVKSIKLSPQELSLKEKLIEEAEESDRTEYELRLAKRKKDKSVLPKEHYNNREHQTYVNIMKKSRIHNKRF